MQYTAIFHGCKNDNFQMKICDIVHIFAQITIYVLEQKYEKHVYPCKPQFYYIKVGGKGVYITRTCFYDGRDFYRHSFTQA